MTKAELTKSSTMEPSSTGAMGEDPEQIIGDCHVVCITGGFGFPAGNASTVRLTLVGRALLSAGVKFHVLHCGPSPVPFNTELHGVHQGISFEYTTGTLIRPANVLHRRLVYLWGILRLLLRLCQLSGARDRTAVYVYIQDGPVGFIAIAACRLLSLPVVQDVNEWWPSEPLCPRFTKWLYNGPMFSLPTGLLAISKAIEERIQRVRPAGHSLYLSRLPILADMDESTRCVAGEVEIDVPFFVWSGAPECYSDDIIFLLDALADVHRFGLRCTLVVTGMIHDVTRQRFLAHARSLSLPRDALQMTGYIERSHLQQLYQHATALLAPLWNNERCLTRYPTKLGEYLASGRPVITCNVGEVSELLTDRLSAYVSKPGDAVDFAERMRRAIQEPGRAADIGKCGRAICETQLDYRVHSTRLAVFFRNCIAIRNFNRRRHAGLFV